jgi:hypothetical protein
VDSRVAWAFSQSELNAGEKLVLVWLAWHAGNGAALMQREQLAAVTEYEPRSLQRILKALRDRGMLHEADGWYSVGQTPGNEAPAFPPQELDRVQVTALVRQVADGIALISPDEIEAAGELIAKHIAEAADGHLNRFNDVSLRLLQGIEKIAQAARVWEESVADAVAPPPPDPVRESVHFKVFSSSGVMNEDEAYDLAKKRLEAEGVINRAPVADTAVAISTASLVRKHATPARDSRQYLDTPLGRFERVRDILDPTGAEPWADAMSTWTQLELAENKHTVDGETEAFELLYPAIVTAARRAAGVMNLAQFLDPKAIQQNRAPWDTAAVDANAPTEQQLQGDLATMLDELERASHPMAIAPARTVEGSLTESLASYHLRVKRVHQQLKKLQDMGV